MMSSGQEIRDIEEGKSRKSHNSITTAPSQLHVNSNNNTIGGKNSPSNSKYEPDYTIEDGEEAPLISSQPKGKGARMKISSSKKARPPSRSGRSRSRSKSPGHSLYDDPFGGVDDLFDESFLNRGPKGARSGTVGPEPKVMYKRNKKGILKPVVVNQQANDSFGGADWKEGIQPQSARAGWVDEQTDDSDNSDVFRKVRKPPTDSNFQIYVIVAVIVMIISVVGSVKLWEFIYGKPKIKENLFDFSFDDKDKD